MTNLWLPGFVPVVKAFDAAKCPDPVPRGYGACMVYAGGSSATRAWDAAELGLVAHKPRLPVWVPTPGTDDPAAAAADFLQWLAGHHVPPVNSAGEHVRVLWDMETGKEPDPAWLDAAADVTAKAGFFNLTYGSVSTLFGQPVRSGVIVADWTGQPHLWPAAHIAGTQYANNVRVPGGTIDADVFTADLVRALWLP